MIDTAVDTARAVCPKMKQKVTALNEGQDLALSIATATVWRLVTEPLLDAVSARMRTESRRLRWFLTVHSDRCIQLSGPMRYLQRVLHSRKLPVIHFYTCLCCWGHRLGESELGLFCQNGLFRGESVQCRSVLSVAVTSTMRVHA